jgi:hypothetical protein
MGLWFRIPFKAWMSACVHSVFVLGRGFETGWSPVQRNTLLTRTMGLRVRIPFKAWISACVHSVFVLGRGFSTGWSPVQRNILLTRTMGLRIRIPFKAWMSACIHSVCVLGSGFATGWFAVQGVLPIVLDWGSEFKLSVSRMSYDQLGATEDIRTAHIQRTNYLKITRIVNNVGINR